MLPPVVEPVETRSLVGGSRSDHLETSPHAAPPPNVECQAITFATNIRRMRILGGVAILAAGLMLGGCAAIAQAVNIPEMMEVDRLVTSDVDPASTPLFLSDPQTEIDMIGDQISSSGIDSDSIRYQGEWDDTRIYLGVVDETTVRMILLPLDIPDGWGAGGSLGNTVFGMATGTDGKINLQYVPHGTAEPPEGWIALSDWVIVRH